MARKKKINGLGDLVEAVTEATGIKALMPDDCGCDERKKKLNDLFPFGKKIIQCATDEQKEYLEALFVKEPTQLSFSQQRELMAIYLHSFGINLEQSQCPSCWRSYLNDLKRLMD